MKKPALYALAFLFLFPSCKKTREDNVEQSSPVISAYQFTKYTIHQGQQYCNGNNYKTIETGEMKFVVKFDSTAIYQNVSLQNQYDINKLYGFSDNNSDHHQYSARIGWRWSDKALRLFAYVYNEGAMSSKELTSISIGAEIFCSIKVSESNYLFTVNNVKETMPRTAATSKGRGYQLYPYFGGDEVAPHDKNIWIKISE